MNEKLSQLVDDELPSGATGEVLTALEQNSELRNRWHRYHLIGAVLRQDWEASVDPMDLARRIHAGVIAEESAPVRRRFASSSTWGAGLAASAAAVSLLGWFAMSPEPLPATQVASTPPATAQTLQVAASPPVAASGIAAGGGGTHWDTLSPDTVRKLNAYLVEHGEFASMRGLSGVTAYARFVSYDD